MYYSPSKDCVYLEDFKEQYEMNGTWPSDLIDISDADFQEFFLSDVSKNHIRKFNDGSFYWVPIQPDLASPEREWRNSELFLADIEIYKIQDGANGSVAAWRAYRKLLRDWPQHPDFPNKISRPVSP
ncbi:hypothetical protein D3C85_1147820 [compost metagenome]